MADSIVKLRVDSKEYDARINSARQGLLAMEQACRKVGGTFEVVEKEELKFVQALGQMETQSNTTKGKLRELTNTINDLTTMYKGMTDLERQGEFGKAMEASIKQLKGRAADLQDQMADLNEELKHMSSDTGFTDGMRNMTGVIGSCASAVVAFTGDSKELDVVIKDLAKIQTTVAAVEALTKAFQKQNLVMMKNPYVLAATAIAAVGVTLYELSTRESEAAAQVKMTDEAIKSQVDTLINLEKIANSAAAAMGNLTKSQAKAQYDSALANLTAAQGTRKSLESHRASVQTAYEAAKRKYDASVQTTVSPTTGISVTTYDKQARDDMEKYRQMLKDIDKQLEEVKKQAKEADKAVAEANAKFRRAKDDPVKGGTGSGNVKAAANEVYTPVEGSIDAMKAKIADLERQFNATADDAIRGDLKTAIEECNAELDKMTGKAAEAAAKAAKAVEEANTKRQERSASLTSGFNSSVQGIVNPTASIGDQYKGKGSKEEDFQRLVQQYDQLAATIAKAKEQNADGAIVDPSAILAAETELDNLRSKIEEIGPAIQANMNFQSMLDSVSQVQSVFGSISSVANGIKSIGSEWDNVSNAGEGFLATINTITTALGIFNTVMTAVNTIQTLFKATTIATTAVESGQAATTGTLTGLKYGELAATIPVIAANKALTASYLEAAAAAYFAAHAYIPFVGFGIASGFVAASVGITKGIGLAAFAEGGEVKGGAFAGDAVPIMANAGEVVLSASMQQNLASNLTNNGGGGGTATTTIKGEQLITVINNTRKRKGKGEIL